MNNLSLFEEPTEPPVEIKGLSAKELTAINWYAKNNNLRPELSALPLIYFSRKIVLAGLEGDEVFKMDKGDILDQWKVWNEEDKKQRALERKVERELHKRGR